MALGASGDPRFGKLSKGQQVQVTAQFLYGYGYWGPFFFTFENPRRDCGITELEYVLDEYTFLTDMETNYGFLNSYSGSDPRSQLTDVNDPTVLQYYSVEFDHAIRRSLYCLVSSARHE